MGFIDGLQHFSCQGFCAGPTQRSPHGRIVDLLKAGLTDQRYCKLCHQIMNGSSDIFENSSCSQLCNSADVPEFRQTLNIY